MQVQTLKTEKPWKSGEKQQLSLLVDLGLRNTCRRSFNSPRQFSMASLKSDLLTPIRATQNTRRVLIAGQQSLLGRMRCFPLEWRHFRCRNPDCCNNKPPRCNQVFACVGQVRDHGGGCGTSWEHGSEILDLAPCRIFPNYPHWRTVNNLNLTFCSECSLYLRKHAR